MNPESCPICGACVWTKLPTNTRQFCDECLENPELMEWYRSKPPVKGAQQLYWEAHQHERKTA